MSKLRTTIQTRYACRSCGEYTVEYVGAQGKWAAKHCHWCQKPGLIKLASCIHKTPYYIKPGPSRPRKRMLDWVGCHPDTEFQAAGDKSRRSGKGGRKKKPPLDNRPYRAPAPPVEVEEFVEALC